MDNFFRSVCNAQAIDLVLVFLDSGSLVRDDFDVLRKQGNQFQGLPVPVDLVFQPVRVAGQFDVEYPLID